MLNQSPIEILSEPNADPTQVALAMKQLERMSETSSSAGGLGFVIDELPSPADPSSESTQPGTE